MIQIYHNRCGKSRNCVAYVEEGKEYEIIKYLETLLL
jgi:arsenate reductase-like glutaredoxin family protein